MVCVTSNRHVTKKRRDCCNSLVDKENSIEEEMRMTVISCSRGLEESHKHNKKSSKGMSDEGLKRRWLSRVEVNHEK